MLKNPAYKELVSGGMRPAIAKYFLTRLRRAGYVIVKEGEIDTTKKINRQIEIIIKLMKMKGRRK